MFVIHFHNPGLKFHTLTRTPSWSWQSMFWHIPTKCADKTQETKLHSGRAFHQPCLWCRGNRLCQYRMRSSQVMLLWQPEVSNERLLCRPHRKGSQCCIIYNGTLLVKSDVLVLVFSNFEKIRMEPSCLFVCVSVCLSICPLPAISQKPVKR